MNRNAIHCLGTLVRMGVFVSIFFGPIAAIAANHNGQDRAGSSAVGLVLYFSLR